MKKTKLFKNGQSQAVRLPKEFRFQGKEVYIRKLGSVVMLIPKNAPWQLLRESLEEFSSDFLLTRDQPPIQKRKGTL